MPSLTLRHSAILIGGCLVALPAIASAGAVPSSSLVSSVGDTNLGTVVAGETASKPACMAPT